MCIICGCKETIDSLTTYMIDYKGCVIVVRNVPCKRCAQCGEERFTNDVAKRLNEIVKQAKSLMKEVSILYYDQAA